VLAVSMHSWTGSLASRIRLLQLQKRQSKWSHLHAGGLRFCQQ